MHKDRLPNGLAVSAHDPTFAVIAKVSGADMWLNE